MALVTTAWPNARTRSERAGAVDAYFSADVETDGPIPGPYSMLSFALVFVGTFDGETFERAETRPSTYIELRPIAEQFDPEALRVNGLDRDRLLREGCDPHVAMDGAAKWIQEQAGTSRPVLVAYPVSFDWTWLYWYFVRYAKDGSPFNHSQCYDLKTAFAVKAGIPIVQAGRSRLLAELQPEWPHTHHALDDAQEQAEIFARLFAWKAPDRGGTA